MSNPEAVRNALNATKATLLAARNAEGHWTGELSSSALSTATALFTLSLMDRDRPPAHADLIRAGLRWLVATQHPDGGFGDTVKSKSNVSTTALVWAALAVPEAAAVDGLPAAAKRVEAWLTAHAGGLDAPTLSRAVVARYGRDRTFSVPILTMLALAGRLGADPWRWVPQLPFEVAAVPFGWFKYLKLPVVSYALPALIAIGQVRHARRPTWNPLARLARRLTRARTLRVLRTIQPTTGGYLEATPLTSFVAMSLLGAGERGSPVLAAAEEFLTRSARPDGSWPIDTNLATWATTLAVNAGALDDEAQMARDDAQTARELPTQWLLKQQYRARHPYTDAPPGGWAWTDLAGGVPDADDTPGALLALRRLAPDMHESLAAAELGVTWLLNLQNRDGGVPTFCRGWGTLPFDRSSNDLTAHTLLAWDAWRDALPARLQARIARGLEKAAALLLKTQRLDGSWAPLWFGNEHADEVENLTHGTSRVLRLAGLQRPPKDPRWPAALARAAGWLAAAQNPDGGWGGRPGTPSSIEETALALEGLTTPGVPRDAAILERGAAWLIDATAGGTQFAPSPIGFYFANLWYFEALYPVVFTHAALARLAAV